MTIIVWILDTATSISVYATPFQLKTENVLCILAVALHDDSILRGTKCKLLKLCFKMQVFESDTVIASV